MSPWSVIWLTDLILRILLKGNTALLSHVSVSVSHRHDISSFLDRARARAYVVQKTKKNDSFLPEKHHCIVLQFYVWVAESMNCNAWIFLSRSLFRSDVAETDEKVFSKKSRFNVLFFSGWLTSCGQLNRVFCVPFKLTWLIFIRISKQGSVSSLVTSTLMAKV